MTARRIIAAGLVAMLALGACAKPGERVMFNGKFYPAKAKKAGDRREDFAVTVRRVGQGIDGARAAGEHAGIRYCVETFGDSKIDWQPGSDPNATNIRVEGDTMVMRGSCVEW